MPYKIKDIQIKPVMQKNGLVAFANVILDDCLQLTSIAIHKRLYDSGYRLTYPTKKVGSKDQYIFFPINKEMSKALEKAIIEKYLAL